jgi:hypothetical protein
MLLRKLRRFCQGRGAATDGTPAAVFGLHDRAFAQAQILVQVHYLFLLFWYVLALFLFWSEWRAFAQIDPLWPVVWLPALGIQRAVDLLALASFATGILALAQPERRLWRALTFLCFFFLYAFINSRGRIGHDGHAWIVVAFLLIWLPAARRPATDQSVTYRQRYLAVIWAAQFFMGLFYSMSGAWKVVAAVQQIAAGQLHTFHPYALANLTAARLLETNSASVLGWLVIDYPLLGWPLHLGAVYLELFAVVAVFRPALHKLWGLGLITFHIGSWLFLTIAFQTNIFLLGLLFVMSPFAPRTIVWPEVLGQLPLIGSLWDWFNRRFAPARGRYSVSF